MKKTVICDVMPCSRTEFDRRFIGIIMEEVSTSKTSVNFHNTTQQNNPQDSNLLLLLSLALILYAKEHSNM
jgi:hypothetical protein